MREKVAILEREKRKLSEENISLKRELIKMQDLLSGKERFQRAEKSTNHEFQSNATETIQPRTNNTDEWQFRLVTATPEFFSSNPSFETRNRFQQLSNLPAGNDERHQSYANAVVTEHDQARKFKTRRVR